MKKVCAGIAQTSYQALKSQIFKFLVKLGPSNVWGNKLHMGINAYDERQ